MPVSLRYPGMYVASSVQFDYLIRELQLQQCFKVDSDSIRVERTRRDWGRILDGLIKSMSTLVCMTLLIFLIGSVASSPIHAKDATPDLTTTYSENPPPSESEKEAIRGEVMSIREFRLSCIILAFGVFIVIVEYFLLRGVVQEKTEEIARTYTVTLIIIGTLVLISSGFTNAQIAPALGLFGTIAGYLLGKSDRARERRELARKGVEDDN